MHGGRKKDVRSTPLWAEQDCTAVAHVLFIMVDELDDV